MIIIIIIIIKKAKRETKYMNLASERRKLCNMKVMVIPILIGTLRTVPKSLQRRLGKLEISGLIETIQTTALLRSARILRRVLET